jgi:hypothetical protein
VGDAPRGVEQDARGAAHARLDELAVRAPADQGTEAAGGVEGLGVSFT